MKFVIQRVRQSSVFVREECIGSIDKGLLVFVGIRRGDSKDQMRWMIDKLLGLRIFSDKKGKMNHSVTDVKGGVLMIPNFTLYGDVSHGKRPGFSEAESSGRAREMYDTLVAYARDESDLAIETGEFGADMQVELVNDGPVTIVLER